MRITGGQTISVYRPVREGRHGDVLDNNYVGDISNCVFQWASAASVGLRFHLTKDFQESSDLSAVIFCPRDAEVKLESRDRFVMNGNTFQVIGDRAWDETHPATGYDYGYYMMQVEMVS